MEDLKLKKATEEVVILRPADEKKEAYRQRRAEQQRRYRQKLLSSRTPEELKALQKIANAKQKQRYQAKVRRTQKSEQERVPPRELKALPVKRTEQVKKNRLKPKTEGTFNKAEARSLKVADPTKQNGQKPCPTPEETETMRLKNVELPRCRNQKPKEIDPVRIKQMQSEKLRKKKEKENSILKHAMELEQNKTQVELSAEEKEILRQAEVIKAKRIKKNRTDPKRYYEVKKASLTLEEREAIKQKRSERQKLYRKQRVISRTPEELEAVRKRMNEKQRERYERRKKLLSTLPPEELEARRLEKNRKERLYRRRCKLNADPKNETPEQRETRRTKRNEIANRYRLKCQLKAASKKEKTNLKQTEEKKHHRQMVLAKNKAVTEEILNMTKNTNQWLKTKDQTTSNFPVVEDEIKIENEVLQETTIKTIAKLPTAAQILALEKGAFDDSSSSCLNFKEKSFMNGCKSKNQRYFQSFDGGLSNTQERFANSQSSRSTILDRRKYIQEVSFRYMRVLIEATAKSDKITLFGKQIAQKLRSCKKDVAEVNIAKQLVDKILQNLKTGVHHSEKKIVQSD